VLAQRVRELGCDWIDVSSGGLSPLQQIPAGPGYQVPLAREIRRASGLLTSAVGLITQAQQAEDIVSGGAADLVTLARALLWNPHWPWQAAAELGASVTAPAQYWRSQPHGVQGVFEERLVGATRDRLRK
jgi:2,4-dienoyl-CoA reductase-like NADH-dependent reductase (Old Yellow Enzyme family)